MALLLCAVTGAWADEAVISWNMGTNGAAASSANSITGASGSAAEDFSIAISGNNTKSWTNGNGDITYSSKTYKTLKNSNGAQNTITCPSGKVATQVKFFATSNADAAGKLSEIDGSTCNDEVSSIKDYGTPTEITKSIDNKSSFTFTFSSKQVCFIAVVTYTDASSDFVANPVLSQTGNDLTMTCGTTGAKIYYTIDGSEPTTSSTMYSSAITLDNSCTVRAKAYNGESNEYSSEIVKKDCYVSHATALAVLGYQGGSLDSDSKIWTSNDGLFILTDDSWSESNKRTIGYVNLAGSQDGFKLNHTDSYTLQPSEGIKVTKLVVVGKTWLSGSEGNASTIAFDGFTPASGVYYDYLTDGETYVKTIEFTPSEEQSYGQAITMRPGGNQLGAYIEVYGETKTYAVTYAAGANGTGTVAAGEKSYGKAFTLSSSKFTRDGYVQTGWATSDGGPQVYALGGSYTANDDVTLYPVWSQIEESVVGSWDFTAWSDATITGVKGDEINWRDYETSADNKPLNTKCYSNKAGNSEFVYDSTVIPETEGLTFATGAYSFGLAFDLGSTSLAEGGYHGSKYLWLYGSSSVITIPNLTAGSTIEIGVESHKLDGTSDAKRTLNVTNTAESSVSTEAYKVAQFTVSADGNVTIYPSKGMHIYYITVTENVETVPVSTVSGRNYATCVATKKLDFSAADGITAYIATGLNGAMDAVVLQEVSIVPTGTPIIVKTETKGATVNVPVTTATADNVDANKLVAGDGTTAGDTGTYYYLQGDLFHLANSGTLQSGKAYLQIPSGAARELSIGFADSDVTAIKGVKAVADGEVYNLSGQRVAAPTKGLYIVNGKKVVVK